MSKAPVKKALTTKSTTLPKKGSSVQISDSSKTKQQPRMVQQPRVIVKGISQAPDVVPTIAKPKKAKKNSDEQGLWDFAGDALSGMAKKALTHGLNLLTGFGDYEIESNSLLDAATNGQNGGVPIMNNSKVANVIRHREYIRDVLSSTSQFSLQTLPINPGLDVTFPWLAAIANCYTNYRLRGMVFEFVPLASQLATTPSLGYFAIATQYNSLDPLFTSKKQMENSEYANSCKPSGVEDGAPLPHPIECATNQLSISELYVRSGDLPTSSDLKFYDVGRLSYAVGGQAASDVVIGELWCTYEVELYFPKLISSQQPISNYAAINANSGVTNAQPLGITSMRGTKNTFTFGFSAGNQVQFPEECIGQQFLFVIQWSGGNTGGLTCPTLTGVGVTVSYNPNGANLGVPVNGSTSSNLMMYFFVQVDATQPLRTLTFGAAGTLPTVSTMLCYVSQVPHGALLEDLLPSVSPAEPLNRPLSLVDAEDFIRTLNDDEVSYLRNMMGRSSSRRDYSRNNSSGSPEKPFG